MWAAWRASTWVGISAAAVGGVATALAFGIRDFSLGYEFPLSAVLLEGMALGFLLGTGARLSASTSRPPIAWIFIEIVLAGAGLMIGTIGRARPLGTLFVAASGLVWATELIFVEPTRTRR